MEPSTPPEQVPPTNPEPQTNPMPPVQNQSNDVEQPVTPNASAHAPAAGKLPGAFSLFKPSWAAVKLNLSTFILLAIVPLLLFVVPSIMQFGSHYGANSLNTQLGTGATAGLNVVTLILGLVGLLVMLLVVGPAVIYTQLKSVTGQKVALGEAIKKGWHFALRFLGLSIVISLIIFVGFLLLIVPGLIFLRRYLLSPFYLIDQDMGINAAMEASAAASKKNTCAIWGILGVELLIGLVGIVPFIGWIISAVMNVGYYCAPAVRYQQFKTLS